MKYPPKLGTWHEPGMGLESKPLHPKHVPSAKPQPFPFLDSRALLLCRQSCFLTFQDYFAHPQAAHTAHRVHSLGKNGPSIRLLGRDREGNNSWCQQYFQNCKVQHTGLAAPIGLTCVTLSSLELEQRICMDQPSLVTLRAKPRRHEVVRALPGPQKAAYLGRLPQIRPTPSPSLTGWKMETNSADSPLTPVRSPLADPWLHVRGMRRARITEPTKIEHATNGI